MSYICTLLIIRSTLEHADIWTSPFSYLHHVLTLSIFKGNFGNVVLLGLKLHKMPNAQNGTQKPLRTQHNPSKCCCKAARALYPLVMNGLFHIQWRHLGPHCSCIWPLCLHRPHNVTSARQCERRLSLICQQLCAEAMLNGFCARCWSTDHWDYLVYLIHFCPGWMWASFASI